MKNTDTHSELFKEHLSAEKVSAARNLSVLGVILFLIFSIADFYSLSSSFYDALAIRTVVISILFMTIFISYSKNFNKYYDLTSIAVVLSAAGGIEAMIYLASPEDHASNVYFAGIVLVNMIVFSWTYLKYTVSASILALIIGTYAFIVTGKGMSTPDVLVNILFLLSAASLGLASMFIRDRYIRENFLLQRQLKEALQAKTEEAKDHEYLANHDALTGLPNRRYMTELLENSMKEAEEKDKVLVIMFLDLNGFKQVNDIYGHTAGDNVLKVVAKRLELAIRSGDHVSRLGGDEYLIGLMMDRDHLGEAENMTEKFSAIIAQPMNIEGIKIKVGASIGLAAYPIHGNKINALIHIADKRMYDAKKGRSHLSLLTTIEGQENTVAFFPGRKA